MKTVGFIDYYISEWHANNYPNWIKEASAQLDEEFVVKYAWAEKYISPVDGKNTDEWCERFGVERCESIAELCAKADYICILAPTNPEKHLEYAREALKCGKNTYIDKTFAPDYKTAAEIFSVAKEYGTRFFTSSALRYASELSSFVGENGVKVSGNGSNFDEYIIHLAEMVVKCLKATVKKVKVDTADGVAYECEAIFEGGKQATLSFSPTLPYAIGIKSADTEVKSAFFAELIKDMIRFFVSGVTSFNTDETLDVMKLRELLIRAKNNNGEWISYE